MFTSGPRRTLVLLSLIARTAAGDPEQHASVVEPRPPPDEQPTPHPPAPAPEPEPTAADVAGAPAPGEESGRTDPDDRGDSTLRRVGRGILFVPKVAVNVVLSPVRASVWAFDRYQLDDLYYRVFFNEARTIGLYPTVALESGFGITGVTGGARFVARDLFGAREHLALQAATGIEYRQLYTTELRSGDRLGKRFELDLDAGYELRPRDGFYGIGNGDTMTSAPGMIDPRTDSSAIEAHYRQDRARIALRGDARVWEALHLRGAGAVSDIGFGPSSQGESVETTYDTSGLVGFAHGVKYAYGELELRWDNRQQVTSWEPRAIYASGSLAAVFGGREHRLDAGADFWRYGFDLQHFVRIARGPRVIAVRLHGEGVSGSRDEVPFTELPKLGGVTFLRGYPLDRFRDRVAAFGSTEYQWDLSQQISASLFVDAGRVFPSLRDASFDHMRVGYGIAIEGHSEASFVVQGSLASSVDGGVFLSLSLNPVFDLDERVRRR